MLLKEPVSNVAISGGPSSGALVVQDKNILEDINSDDTQKLVAEREITLLVGASRRYYRNFSGHSRNCKITSSKSAVE